MDSLRPVLRVSVVFLSLALMTSYVVFSGNRAARPAEAAPAAAPATRPADAAGPTAPLPATLFYGSKSAAVFIDLLKSGEGETPPTALPPATRPTTIFSTSKSMILVPPGSPLPFQPATQPAPNPR